MSIEGIYTSADEMKSKGMEALKRFIKETYPALIILLNVVIMVVSRLFSADFENPFSASFFVDLATNLLSSVFCYASLISYGAKSEEQSLRGYLDNRERWAALSAQVRKTHSDAFTDYCIKEAEDERTGRRRAYVQNHTMRPAQEVEEKYLPLPKAELAKARKKGELTRQDERVILTAQKIRVRRIDPLLILCGVKVSHLNDAGRRGMKRSTLSLIAKPFVSFTVTACLTMFRGSFIGISDLSVIYDMILSAFLVVMSSVAGYSAGANDTRREFDMIKARIFFLEKFLERNNTLDKAKGVC